MGILDDAIRQHLELKRQHGVPEEELQRQEEEALGPARRDVAEHSEEAELAAGQTATAEVDEPAPVSAEQETALFDMEEADASTAAAPAPEVAEPEAEVEEPEAAIDEPEAAIDEPPASMEPLVAETPEPEPAEPTPVEPPPVAPPPDPDESPSDSFAALGDTEPHGFEAVEEDEDEDPLASDPEDPLAPDPEDPLAQEEEDEDLDVLEDTPDFLQETPEHDRLWFEQKPPRDFDFD